MVANSADVTAAKLAVLMVDWSVDRKVGMMVSYLAAKKVGRWADESAGHLVERWVDGMVGQKELCSVVKMADHLVVCLVVV